MLILYVSKMLILYANKCLFLHFRLQNYNIFFIYANIFALFLIFFAPSTPSLCRSCVPSCYPIQPQNKTQIRPK